jgi:hypothetical protein
VRLGCDKLFIFFFSFLWVDILDILGICYERWARNKLLPNAGRVPENRLWTQFAPKQAFK